MPLTQVQPGMLGTPQPINFKNRVINGNMVISQRGTSFSSPNTYTLDRFAFANTGGQTYTVTQSSTAPTGFTNSLSMTNTNSVSAGTTNYQVLYQVIEGYNIADLGWGTAGAKTVTVSFWVRSSVTGNYGLVLRGGASPTYYVLSYSIPVADTWTYITLTAPGCTTDTWNTTTSNGIALYFDLGVGSTYSASVTNAWATGNIFGLTGGTKFSATSGATFYITGVQLEQGVSATDFDVRPYGTELMLCQRYYEETNNNRSVEFQIHAITNGLNSTRFQVRKRATPTVVVYSSNTGVANTVNNGNGNVQTSISGYASYPDCFAVQMAGTTSQMYTYFFTASAEL